MDNVQLRYVFDRLRQADNATKKGLLQIEVRQSGTNVKKLISILMISASKTHDFFHRKYHF
jgi:hypothetical protein